jgi:hypothetical protein
MPTEDKYGEQAKRLLRAEMVRRGMGYEALSQKLGALGLHDTPVNLRNKVSRGKFTAAFLMAACEAMGAEHLRLVD